VRTCGPTDVHDLLDSGLASLRACLDSGAISPVELCEAYLARYKAWEPHLNAFVTACPDRILAQARQAESELTSGRRRSSLHGIPIAIKDNLDAAGEPTTAGSKVYRDRVPDQDAAVVARLRAAGAIIFGKTNLPELAYGPVDSYAYGPTFNPWKAGHFAGGSSMGSGAAVAAGVVPAAIGTDTTGSIRNPASWSGVTGLKPTHGLVPLRGSVPLAPTLDHIGPMARSALDCAIILDCIAGYDDADIYSSSEIRGHGNYAGRTREPLLPIKVGVLRELWEPLIGEVGGITESALALLKTLGVSLVEIRLPLWDDAVSAAQTIVEIQAASVHRQLLADHASELQPQVRERLERGARCSAITYEVAQACALGFRRELSRTFQQVQLIVLPARERTAPGIDSSGARAPGEFGARYLTPFNLAGAPSLVLPCGFDSNDLPVGLQIVAPAWHETGVLQAARAYQSDTDWHLRTPHPPQPIAGIGLRRGEAAHQVDAAEASQINTHSKQ
jgi:aspartyl-tRNA(Asn)/glutamyl-tRNA(Gln) amidotransferase subunit A